jgi:hypothetical protein
LSAVKVRSSEGAVRFFPGSLGEVRKRLEAH